jgi:subtilisin family serine protease
MRGKRLFVVAVLAGVLVSTAAAATNDTHYGLQWSLAQINAESAWATSTGAGQVIAIVDTGVDLGHPDLQGHLVAGATFTGCPTAPNGCGNGDWESGQTQEAPSPHGTHVAGIAAAVTGNGTGVAGVARDARLMPVKVLTDEGGSFEEVAAGIRWAANNGADVINLSLGALPGVQALPLVGELDDAKQAIDYAVSRGVVVVAAAGNEFTSICAEPAFNPNALCVVATDRNEARAAYSNFAVSQSQNVVAAPGGAAALFCADDVVSSVPAGTESVCGDGTPGYDFYAGTSMATPHVAGVAALLTAQGRTVSQVYAVLKSTARTPGVALRGTYTPTYGYGIVDAAAAVSAP